MIFPQYELYMNLIILLFKFPLNIFVLKLIMYKNIAIVMAKCIYEESSMSRCSCTKWIFISFFLFS